MTSRAPANTAKQIVDLRILIDGRPLRRAVMFLRHSVGAMSLAFERFRLSDLEVGRRELQFGRELAADYPGEWEAFCVTTNEGRCRVVSRPRGGWA